MEGLRILTRTLSVPTTFGSSSDRQWQYHSRSDRHSKTQVWAFLFDLLHESQILRSHVAAGKVVFGVNHRMLDETNDREKDLDLVIATPDVSLGDVGPRTFAELASTYDIVLTDRQMEDLEALPTFNEGEVGNVLAAIEAKACMTAHGKAHPRLFSELTDSYNTIHGADPGALAIGLVVVNAAHHFLSPGRNAEPGALVWNDNPQPRSTQVIVDKMRRLRNRSDASPRGFDGLATYAVELQNDGSPVTLYTDDPAPQPGDRLYYDRVVSAMAHRYGTKYRHL